MRSVLVTVAMFLGERGLQIAAGISGPLSPARQQAVMARALVLRLVGACVGYIGLVVAASGRNGGFTPCASGQTGRRIRSMPVWPRLLDARPLWRVLGLRP